METTLAILSVILAGSALAVIVVLLREVSKMRGQVKSLEKQITKLSEETAKQATRVKSLEALAARRKSAINTATDSLMPLLGIAAKAKSRNPWITAALVAYHLVQNAPSRKSNTKLPVRAEIQEK